MFSVDVFSVIAVSVIFLLVSVFSVTTYDRIYSASVFVWISGVVFRSL